MSEITQRTELQAAIWRIADEVRGAVDGWDFKQFVLGSLFYRFISENFVAHMEGDDPQRRYEEYADSEISANAGMIDEVTREKGYFIYPSQLFSVVVAQADRNPNLNTDLAAIFSAIEASAVGYDSERAVKGLFADFDTTSTRLGNTVEEKNRRLCAVLHGVESLDFGRFADHKIDLFGDAYEFLISNYAANAGKSGGEFFTPQNVSRLLARLALSGQHEVNKIYDPACGSGSLLLQAKRQFDQDLIKEGFVGQEINHTTYNLARMNLFLHDVNYSKFDLALGDTLLSPQHRDTKPFDAIVSNPPYSVKWVGSDDPTLINDERFAPAGVLAPKSKADFAFVLHALNHLSARGRAPSYASPAFSIAAERNRRSANIWWTTTLWRRSSPSRPISFSARASRCASLCSRSTRPTPSRSSSTRAARSFSARRGRTMCSRPNRSIASCRSLSRRWRSRTFRRW